MVAIGGQVREWVVRVRVFTVLGMCVDSCEPHVLQQLQYGLSITGRSTFHKVANVDTGFEAVIETRFESRIQVCPNYDVCKTVLILIIYLFELSEPQSSIFIRDMWGMSRNNNKFQKMSFDTNNKNPWL